MRKKNNQAFNSRNWWNILKRNRRKIIVKIKAEIIKRKIIEILNKYKNIKKTEKLLQIKPRGKWSWW